MPAEGMDRRAYLEGKFGGKEGAVRAYAPIVEMAEKVGLSIDFEGMNVGEITVTWSGPDGHPN